MIDRGCKAEVEEVASRGQGERGQGTQDQGIQDLGAKGPRLVCGAFRGHGGRWLLWMVVARRIQVSGVALWDPRPGVQGPQAKVRCPFRARRRMVVVNGCC